MRISPKTGVVTALAVAGLLSGAAPASAGLVAVQPGAGFMATVSYPNFVGYGQRARLNGHISQGGWKVTLFLRAAGEKRFHPAGSVSTGRNGHDFTLRTGRLTRTTRFRLAYTKGKAHAQSDSHAIGVQASVATSNYSYAADGSLHFRVTVAPNQPLLASVRIRGIDTNGARQDISTLGLKRSGGTSVADAVVPSPGLYSSIEVAFQGTASNRSKTAVFTPPPTG